MFADSARPQRAGPCDRLGCQAAPAHFAPEFRGGRDASHGICGAIFLCAGLLRGRARRDRMMCDVSTLLAVFARRPDAFLPGAHDYASRSTALLGAPPTT